MRPAPLPLPDRNLALLRPETAKTQHRLFATVLLLKGLNGLAEIAGSAALLLPGSRAAAAAGSWIAHEVAEDSRSLLFHALRGWSAAWLQADHGFVGVFVLVHGLAKLTLVLLMAAGQSWAYPAAVAVFGALLAYALASLFSTWSWPLAVFALFDAFTIWVIGREWRTLHDVSSFIPTSPMLPGPRA